MIKNLLKAFLASKYAEDIKSLSLKLIKKKPVLFALGIGLLVGCTVQFLLPVMVFDKVRGAPEVSKYKDYLHKTIYPCIPNSVIFTGVLARYGQKEVSIALFGSTKIMTQNQASVSYINRELSFHKDIKRQDSCSKFLTDLYEQKHDNLKKYEKLGCVYKEPFLSCPVDKMLGDLNNDDGICVNMGLLLFKSYISTNKKNYVTFVVKDTNDMVGQKYAKIVDTIIDTQPFQNKQCGGCSLKTSLLDAVKLSHGDPLYMTKIVGLKEYGYKETIELNLHVFLQKLKHLLK